MQPLCCSGHVSSAKFFAVNVCLLDHFGPMGLVIPIAFLLLLVLLNYAFDYDYHSYYLLLWLWWWWLFIIYIYIVTNQIYWNIHVQKPAPHERPLCMYIYILYLYIYIHIIFHIFINSIPPFSVVVIPTSAFFAFSSPAGPSGRQTRSVSSHKRCEKEHRQSLQVKFLWLPYVDLWLVVDLHIKKQLWLPCQKVSVQISCSAFHEIWRWPNKWGSRNVMHGVRHSQEKGACEWCHIRGNIG